MERGYDGFLERLDRVRGEIADYCREARRAPEEVTLLPVTKNHGPEAAEFCLRAGLGAVGENRVQEALGKMDHVDPKLNWELIGPLQSNKAARSVASFARIQTVEREKILNALQRHAADQAKILPILIQVNAGNDPAKSGLACGQVEPFLERALQKPNLEAQGLMTIAPLSDDAKEARSCFAALRECRDKAEAALGVPLPVLSMGMSGDMREAILEGSAMVRVGTALFGKREIG